MTAPRVTGPDDPYADWDASYVLGALSADERRDFELHLRDCSGCQAAVADLAGMPGLLAKVATDDAVGLDTVSAPPVAHEAVQDLARAAIQGRARRRQRTTLALVAAAVLLFSGGMILGVGYSSQQSATPSYGVTSSPIVLASVGGSSVTGMVQLESEPWGTRVTWSCDYGDGSPSESYPASYSLVVTDASGAQTTVGTWLATGAHTTGLSGSTSVTTVKSIEIRRGNTTEVLATHIAP